MGVIESIANLYVSTISVLPITLQKFVNLFLLILLVLVYVIFIWKLDKFVAKKNILELNLKKYNKSEHPAMEKSVAGLFYFLEYIVILPFLIFFWFAVFTIFLILLTENASTNLIILSCAVILSVIRIVSYYNENIAKELAKLLPLNLLAVAFFNANFFNFEKIINNISQIPPLIEDIVIYWAFIILLEIVLRFFDFFFSLFNIKEV